MSIYSQTTATYLWSAQPVLQAAVAVMLWRRKVQKRFPVFFAFLLVQIAAFGILFPLYGRSETAYFWIFWGEQAINAALGFKIIHEIFLDVFRPYHALQDLGTPVFKWAGAVMVLVSVVVAASNSFPQSPIIHAIVTLQRSVRTVQFGLILFLVIFARFLGVSRRQLCFGIALGFGFSAGVELMLLAMYSGRFIGRNHFSVLNMFAYDVSMIAWVGYAWFSIVVRETAVNPLRTQRWEKNLTDLQRVGPSDSLIPMFEGMVERAFSRSSSVDSGDDLMSGENGAQTPRAKSAGAGSKGTS